VGRADHHEPDALPGVQHVLRSDPGGVRVIDDQLRRRSVGAPAARSLLLTILGEYVLPRGEAVWQETLVGALVSVGYTQQAARQALARSVRDGWLETVRHGRRARVSLSGGTAELLRTGAERIYSFGSPWEWDGRWLVLVLRVPEARREVRHQIRTRLAWAGLGSMGGGVWLTPHVEREAELREAVLEAPAAEATSFVASLGALGRAEDVVAAAWDLDSVRSAYEVFISDFVAIRPSSAEAFFRMQTLLVHAWRRFPFLDPDLPSHLLPAGWPRRRAHELFTGRHSRWAVPASDHFEELELGRSSRAIRAA
jgi:phenylacetic acid degradation operon negative regulatory protein